MERIVDGRDEDGSWPTADRTAVRTLPSLMGFRLHCCSPVGLARGGGSRRGSGRKKDLLAVRRCSATVRMGCCRCARRRLACRGRRWGWGCRSPSCRPACCHARCLARCRPLPGPDLAGSSSPRPSPRRNHGGRSVPLTPLRRRRSACLLTARRYLRRCTRSSPLGLGSPAC
ncbi:hypothetical protein ACLOJK_004250 [Asimina triloba]